MVLLYRSFWIAVFAAIAAVSVPTFGKPDSALEPKDFGRDGSVNSVLEQTLDVPKASEAITKWLAQLPPGKPILIVAPPDNMPAAITADLVSYLAWPRPVDVSSDPARSRTLLGSARGHYCAVGLCYMSPPARAPISKTFGPALSFIVLEER